VRTIVKISKIQTNLSYTINNVIPNLSYINDAYRSKLIEEFNDFDTLINSRWQNVRVGRYVASTLVRSLRRGFLDLNNSFVNHLLTSMKN
jgi:hypothetical protein